MWWPDMNGPHRDIYDAIIGLVVGIILIVGLLLL